MILFSFFSAYLLTLIIETVSLYLLLRKKYRVGKIILNSVIANTLTLPFVWFVFPLFEHSWIVYLAISELFAWIIEAVFYKVAFEKLGWFDVFAVSFICNCLSLGFGLLLM